MQNVKQIFTGVICLLLLSAKVVSQDFAEITTGGLHHSSFDLIPSGQPLFVSPDTTVRVIPEATAHCFCKVTYANIAGLQHATAECMDLTNKVNKAYTGLDPDKEANQIDCASRCTAVAAALTQAEKQSIADCACAANMPSGTRINAYSSAGTKKYRSAHQIGILTNAPAVTQTTCKCPQGWLSDTNVDGGVTVENCKKGVCDYNSVSPFPPDGTKIGTWGFTWKNAFYAYGNAANGGAKVCNTVVVTPRICRIQ